MSHALKLMRPARREIAQLRSQRWFAASGMRAFAHRQRLQQTGWRRDEIMGRPVIGILNTWSDLSTCHVHLRDRAEAVKRGVIAAGGFPIELPAMSLGEVMVKPTTMFYRNFLAMEAEELIRSHPVDGVVLLGGCDKTTPGLLMGAISAGLPAQFVPAGPALNGWWRGEKLGAGTHTRKYFDALRAGELSEAEWIELEAAMMRSFGTCNTMGTASTMTFLAETLGMAPPGSATVPAADSQHIRQAAAAGERAVAMVFEDLRPAEILSRRAFEDAIVVHCALGGSTNAVIHLTAMARRAGVELTLDDFARIAPTVPLLIDLMPSGGYLMEDLHIAGGSRAVLMRLAGRLDLERLTVSGQSLGANLAGAQIFNEDVIRPLDRPVSDRPALAVLRGTLAPDGAVIKPSAASPHLLRHRGLAVVFETQAELAARIDDPALDIDEHSVLVLKNAGPVGAPGMPEWGALPIPQKLLQRGVRDMVRISDARMSGTHFGCCILHVAPEAAVGGPLAVVRTGDPISLDVAAGRLDLELPQGELAARLAAFRPPPPRFERGYGRLFQAHIAQAPSGCDFDFLAGTAPTAEPEIF